MFHVPEIYRVRRGPMGSRLTDGNNGVFVLPGTLLTGKKQLHRLVTIASDGEGWEHVSVHAELGGRELSFTPEWADMVMIKDMFWDGDDCVMQLHPPKSRYVNVHPNCLHLWRPIGIAIPVPPTKLV